jgi:hypothetical protein
VLAREVELARAYHRLALFGRLPALDAALALLGRCDEAIDRELRTNLARDLRARPSDYLSWADDVTAAPALLDALRARADGAGGAAVDSAARAAELVAGLARAIEGDALRFVPLSASVLALYRKHVRRKALSGIAERAATHDALLAAQREHKGSARRVLAHLEADAALRLVDSVARLTV